MSEALRVLEELCRRGVDAQGVCTDSREVATGDVFLAMPGARTDGRAYIADALSRGAAAVVWEHDGVRGPPAVAVPTIAVSHLKAVSGEIAAIVYGHPSKNLWLVGVTGTNGKTSVSQWIAQALQFLDRKCAVVGTLGCGFLPELRPSANTTPDAVRVQRALAGFKAAGATDCVMEVSSIGLAEGRLAGCAVDVAVFTNLTRDHLDYHGTMDAYGAAKKQLFTWPGLKTAVINVDDDFGRDLCRTAKRHGVRCLAYGIGGIGDIAACSDEIVVAEDLEISDRGMRFTLCSGGRSATVVTPLLGRFNVSNLLAVAGTLLASDFGLAAIARLLPRLVPPAGRMQALFVGDRGPLAVVDYAHTPDALEQALLALREISTARSGRLICVFGCGGERDMGKRPLMGGVAQRMADEVVVTSDNPRGENPQRIIDEILAGMEGHTRADADRAAAIAAAIGAADARDVVLIAGKGHESHQEISGRRMPFSDLDQARAALERWHLKRRPKS